MKITHLKLLSIVLLFTVQTASGQHYLQTADSLRREGHLMPALMQYAEAMQQGPTQELLYKVASTSALLWTAEMRDTSFHFLNYFQ